MFLVSGTLLLGRINQVEMGITLAKNINVFVRGAIKRLLVALGVKKRSRFSEFENCIDKRTWALHEKILQWAERESLNGGALNVVSDTDIDDVVVRKGLALRTECLEHFKDKLSGQSVLRVLVHVPSLMDSPGGASAFNNLVQGLSYLGVPARALEWAPENLESTLGTFRPTVLLTSDHESYLSKIDWRAVEEYRHGNELKIGLTASLEEYGNTCLTERLVWAKKNNVDFYYSFRTPEYLNARQGYKPFYESGYAIHSVEFGANILSYFPVTHVRRDIDYVFLASSNPDKWPRYFEYLGAIFSNYAGFIDGPGWSKLSRWALQPTHRYLYARARVGLNLHIQDSIDWPSELNERTYILAACGVPQLIDHPKLLSQRFRLEGMFVADDAQQYEELFAYILDNPDEAKKRALMAIEDVYEKHTAFHRAESFALSLMSEFEK